MPVRYDSYQFSSCVRLAKPFLRFSDFASAEVVLMASQSENPVSVELGELLELLNALEAQDSRPIENFATLERMLAAGKTAPAESFSDDRYADAHGAEEHDPEAHDPEEGYSEQHYSEDDQSTVVSEV